MATHSNWQERPKHCIPIKALPEELTNREGKRQNDSNEMRQRQWADVVDNPVQTHLFLSA